MVTASNASQAHPEETLLTFKEAMSYLRVSRSTIYRLMETGQFTGHKVGNTWRFYLADVKACVEAVSTVPGERPCDDKPLTGSTSC